jgi:hypothetical protein
MTSALLGVPAGLWMTSGWVVWCVCSGWGSAAVVYRMSDRGKSVSRLPTAISTVERCDRWGGRFQSFLEFRSRISALSADESGW